MAEMVMTFEDLFNIIQRIPTGKMVIPGTQGVLINTAANRRQLSISLDLKSGNDGVLFCTIMFDKNGDVPENVSVIGTLRPGVINMANRMTFPITQVVDQRNECFKHIARGDEVNEYIMGIIGSWCNAKKMADNGTDPKSVAYTVSLLFYERMMDKFTDMLNYLSNELQTLFPLTAAMKTTEKVDTSKYEAMIKMLSETGRYISQQCDQIAVLSGFSESPKYKPYVGVWDVHIDACTKAYEATLDEAKKDGGDE